MVVQDAFLTDTAQLAQVVLPVAVHAEQEGTFLSSTGQLGVVNQALATNGVRPDWQIISQLGGQDGLCHEIRQPKATSSGKWRSRCPCGPGVAPKLAPPARDFRPTS